MQQVKHTRGALRHLPGIGPRKIEQFFQRGITTWTDLLAHCRSEHLPGIDNRHAALIAELEQAEAALINNGYAHLTQTLHKADHWRVLADAFDDATFLDIETSGDALRPDITLIIAKHRGRLHIFTAEQNLDEFLKLLDGIQLLVTFNGINFDVPQLENHFHIPMRDIGHIDLRWVCYHAQLRGGLKEVERAVGLIRPPDLIGMDGAEAAWLWQRWKLTGNSALLQRLTRYCAADVIGLEHLSRWLIARHTNAPLPDFHWHELPHVGEITAPARAAAPTIDTNLQERLRARLRAMQRV